MPDLPQSTSRWPAGDGEMTRRIREHDWAATPLGPVEGWPRSLRTAVDMVLAMPGPADILWGPAHVQLYNDAYAAEIARDRHPALLGRPAAEGWPEVHAGVLAPVMEAAFAGRATRLADLSVALRGPDGRLEERAFDTTWSPIPDGSGAVGGALEILVEATDRRRMEASLRESEARHRLLIESWTQAVWETDADGGVVAGSPSWRAYTGQTLEEWLGHGWLDAIHPDDRAYAERQWREAIAVHGLVDAEFRLRAPDGGWRWTNVRAAPVLDARGHVEKWAGMNIDIDARKRAEAALKKAEARQSFLLGLSDALRPIGDPIEIQRTATRMLGEHLEASRVFYVVVEGDGDTAAILGEYTDGVPSRVGRYSLSAFSSSAVGEWRAGRIASTGDVDTDPRYSQAERAAYASVSTRAGFGVPLIKEGRLVALLGVNQSRPRHWTGHDTDLAGEVAERTWAAVERARAEAALRESEARHALLVRFSDEVRGLSDPALVAGASCRILTERLGTDRALWAVVDRDTREYVAEWAFRADGTRAEPSRWSLDPRDPFAAEHLAGRSVAYDDGEADPRIPGPVAAAMADRGLRAGIAVPVLVAGTLRAVLNTSQPTAPRRWRREEVAFVEALAGRAWAEIERARAEAALRESEGRFRALAEAIEDVFYMTDLDRGALLYLSPSYERVWGRPVRDLLADLSGFEATIHPDDRPVFEAAKAAQARGEPVAGEYRIVRPDGAVRWMHDRSFPVPGGPGRRAAGIAADVTARKRAEDALRASEERSRLIVENARDHAIFATDPEDRITDWLPGARAVFGWTAEEAVGRPAAMIFTPEDRERGEPEREVEIARRDGTAPNVRWHLKRDGSRVFIQGTVAAMRDADGTPRGFLKIGQDVTERREAEERLARSEALFRTLATGIQSLVFRGGPDGARTWGSPQWVDFAGLSFEDSLGFGWLEAIHPEDREATLAAWREAAGAGEYYAEHRIRRAADGEWRWHQTRARPRDGVDGVGGEWVGAMTDVHDLRELQGRQGVLVAELQHRTRNLLAVVRSLAEKTMAGAAGLDEFRAAFRDRLSALSRVQGLLSRLAEGERVAFDDLIRAELTALGAIGADGQGPQVALDGPPGVRLRSGTVQTFALALHELATNAVKYGALSRPEGRLRVSWRLEAGADGERRLHVAWHESGVAVPAPADGTPRRTGYGRELIERALPYQLKARTRYELGPDGVRCTIAVPVSAERATGGPGHA